MKITYTIDGGRRPAPAHERLDIADDGSFTMWRSLSSLSTPPSPIGLFRGSLAADVSTALQEAARAAVAAGDLSVAAAPDGAVQTITLDGATARVGVNADAGGAWGPLVAILRRQLDVLTAHPSAVIEVDVAPGGDRAALRHEGNESIGLELSGSDVRVVIWRGGAKAGDWRSGELGSGRVSAGPGWSLDVPLTHGVERHDGDETHVYVTLHADDGGRAVVVQLLHLG